MNLLNFVVTFELRDLRHVVDDCDTLLPHHVLDAFGDLRAHVFLNFRDVLVQEYHFSFVVFDRIKIAANRVGDLERVHSTTENHYFIGPDDFIVALGM